MSASASLNTGTTTEISITFSGPGGRFLNNFGTRLRYCRIAEVNKSLIGIARWSIRTARKMPRAISEYYGSGFNISAEAMKSNLHRRSRRSRRFIRRKRVLHQIALRGKAFTSNAIIEFIHSTETRLSGYGAMARPPVPLSGLPKLCARGEFDDKWHHALPFICGMLPLVGGLSVTPFFKPAVTGKPIFTPLPRLNSNYPKNAKPSFVPLPNPIHSPACRTIRQPMFLVWANALPRLLLPPKRKHRQDVRELCEQGGAP